MPNRIPDWMTSYSGNVFHTGALKMHDRKMQDWKMTDLKMA